jgi:cell division protein FtsL
MADSSARKIVFEPNKVSEPEQKRRKRIVLDPHKVPFNRLEKTLLVAGSAITLAMMTFLVSSSISATSAQHELANVEQEVTTGKNRTTDLRQEIGDLTSSKRINKIAQEKGLKLIENNIRTIR